ncbi:MAG: hypothetical protein CL916_05080 [Deltaproteobacteria bacterium]|nr:hypothetical protein [Deltaproteobacteria bacterium]
MPASYTQKMLSFFSNSNDSGLKSFIDSAGLQLRAPIRSKYKPEQTAVFLKESFELLCSHNQEDISTHITPSERGFILHNIMLDQPFIVDTIRMQLQSIGASNVSGYNIVVQADRNEENNVERVSTPLKRSPSLKSIVRFEVEGSMGKTFEEIQAKVNSSLQLARSMVQDFNEMTSTVSKVVDRFTRTSEREPDQQDVYAECASFLRWLLEDNFVFMAMSFGEKNLGFLSSSVEKYWSADHLLNWTPTQDMISAQKGNIESPVHRLGQIDELCIYVPTEVGQERELLRIQGLFTYRAVTQSSRRVPVLRKNLKNLLFQDGCQSGTYRYKGICNVFDSLPTEFLFTTDIKQLAMIIDRVLESEQEQEARASIVQMGRTDNAFILTAMPRSHWSENKRKDLEKVIRTRTGASYCDHGIFAGRYNTMLLHFFATGTHALSDEEKSDIENELIDICTPWITRLQTSLTDLLSSDEKSFQYVSLYQKAFEPIYKQRRPINEAALDIINLERVRDINRPIVKLITTNDKLYLRVYQHQNLLLSDMMPVIDNFGFRIVDQFADPVYLPTGQTLTIDSFRLASSRNIPSKDIIAQTESLCEGMEAVFEKKMSSDPMNRLLIQANLSWKAVDMFRGLYNYARQLSFPFSIQQTQSIMCSSPENLRLLWKFFSHKFDPKLQGSTDHNLAKEESWDEIRKLSSQAQDRVFRTFHNLIDGMLRTNFYREDKTEHYLSFKFECSKIQNMPEPRMMVEVYIHHFAMEGIHLRGGKIARGGIRWSDRFDFRKEVLDLVSTQMVKNVLIVPEGAKGGFRMKENIQDRGQRRARADELYQILVRGLLDITDNRVGDDIVTPPNVVLHDPLDPYLVVAADKGTAHLSDTANKLSISYGFWLGDAFASGGSNGYDHKKVGITARGAWKTTKRHFLERGINPETDTFTAIGIGDPAGDVFGNGVVYLDQKTLPNKNMKLLAAFNHMHIVLDPDPDPQVSYEERVRLFEAVKGWGAYNTDLLSEGGGIYSRASKTIPLSPQVKKMLGVITDELPPEAVIRLILRMNVDLLWNGGIGTYIRSSDESDLDAGDPSNDLLRIAATDLRARIIGEGGNLGFTQNARIEFALANGCVNTDAIDNSGGVDMSDHEVNLKILLNPMVQAGTLSLEDRNSLLEEMTEEVAQMVLHNNDTHGRQLSLDVLRSIDDPMQFSSIIQWVCTKGNVIRSALRLPSDEELIRRHSVGQGLSRPELAVLAAHVKMHIFKSLKDVDTSTIPNFEQQVQSYFPQKIQEKYGSELQTHMLRPSIGFTVILNDIVGWAGAWLFPGLSDITGAQAHEIIYAWQVAMETIQVQDLLKEINEKCTSLDASYYAWTSITKPIYSLLTTWLFSREYPSQEQQKEIRTVLETLPKYGGKEFQNRHQNSMNELKAHNVPVGLAQKIATLSELCSANEIVLSKTKETSLKNAVVSYYALGEASCFLPIIRLLEDRRSSGGWDPAAKAILQSRFLHLQGLLVDGIDLGPELQIGVDRLVQRLKIGRLKSLSEEMDAITADAGDLASLIVANARALSRVKREYSASNPHLGTNVGAH